VPTLGCPEAIQRMMVDCWQHAPERRPEYGDLLEVRGEVIYIHGEVIAHTRENGGAH
jgi:hypothetical protein